MLLALICLLLAICNVIKANVVINEIMYNSPIGGKNDYIELFNSGDAEIDISGWTIDAVKYVFPMGTKLASKDFIVVAKNKERLLLTYEFLNARAAKVLGDFDGGLQNDGEKVELKDGTGVAKDTVRYRDSYPWTSLADDLGSSLERLCASADGNNAGNWAASPPPQEEDYRIELSGSPTLPNSWQQCPPFPETTVSGLGLYFSEIMYNAVGEPMMRDQYEYVELINRSPAPINLAHFRLHGKSVRYRFKEGVTLAPNARIVVAANPAALTAAWAAHGGTSGGDVVGPYRGSIGNGGDKLVISDNNGREIETAAFDDQFPWPQAPDGLAGDDGWLEAGHPLKGDFAKWWKRGYSLHRVDFDHPKSASRAHAWLAAEGTPTRPIAMADMIDPADANKYAPVVVEIDTKAQGADGPIAQKETVIRVRTEPFPSRVAIEKVELFWYKVVERGVWHAIEETESRQTQSLNTKLTMTATSNGAYEAKIPGLLPSSVARYRVEIHLAGGKVVRSPRESDGQKWHAFFVPPPPEQVDSKIYRMFIRAKSWRQLYLNAEAGRLSEDGCTEARLWNSQEPIVFVYKDRVMFARTRHQGSTYNRRHGDEVSLAAWTRTQIGPSGGDGGKFKVLSWRIRLPPWASVGGRRVIVLNKLRNHCTFYGAPLHFSLADELGLLGHGTSYARLHVNGKYFRYMMQLDRPGSDAVEDWMGRIQGRCPKLPTLKIGHLFKASGFAGNQGAYGKGTLVELDEHCGFKPEQRYEATYGRKTHFGKADSGYHTAFIKLLKEMNALDLQDKPACQAWYSDNFDVNLMLSYIAMQNWAGIWDDNVHNWFIYQRIEDGRWVYAPWDADDLYGEHQSKQADASLFEGKNGDLDQGTGLEPNVMKNSFITCFEDELLQRYALLQKTLYVPDQTDKLFTDIRDSFSERDFNSVFGSYSVSPAQCAMIFEKFLPERHGWIDGELQRRGTLPPSDTAINPCPSIPEISSRVYNTYRAKATVALAQPRNNVVGELGLSWLSPNQFAFSPSGTKRRRSIVAVETHVVPASGYVNDSTLLSSIVHSRSNMHHDTSSLQHHLARRQTGDVVLKRGSMLRYVSTNPGGDTWRTGGFDDSSWMAVNAPIGYGLSATTTNGDLVAGVSGAWIRMRVQLTKAQFDAMKSARVHINAHYAADLYINNNQVADDATQRQKNEPAYWSQEFTTPKSDWKQGDNVLAAYVWSDDSATKMLFDMEIELLDTAAPSSGTGGAAPPEDGETFPPEAAVAEPRPDPIPMVASVDNTPLADGAMVVLERAELTVGADGTFGMPMYAEVYSGTEREYTDKGVTEGVWYAYRIKVDAGEFSEPQLVRTLTQAEFDKMQDDDDEPAASGDGDMTWLYILLGALGGVCVLGLIIGAIVYFVKNRGDGRGSYQPAATNNSYSPAATISHPSTTTGNTFGAPSATNSTFASQQNDPLLTNQRQNNTNLHNAATFQGMQSVKTITSINDISGPIATYNAGAPSAPGGLGGNEACEVCGNRYPSREDVEIHKRKRHPDDPRTHWPNGKPAVIITGGGAGNTITNGGFAGDVAPGGYSSRAPQQQMPSDFALPPAPAGMPMHSQPSLRPLPPAAPAQHTNTPALPQVPRPAMGGNSLPSLPQAPRPALAQDQGWNGQQQQQQQAWNGQQQGSWNGQQQGSWNGQQQGSWNGQQQGQWNY